MREHRSEVRHTLLWAKWDCDSVLPSPSRCWILDRYWCWTSGGARGVWEGTKRVRARGSHVCVCMRVSLTWPGWPADVSRSRYKYPPMMFSWTRSRTTSMQVLYTPTMVRVKPGADQRLVITAQRLGEVPAGSKLTDDL